MRLTNRFIQHGSMWGVIYRVRCFIDGTRVSKAEFDRAYRSAGLDNVKGKFESGPGWWRKTWEA